MTNNKLKCPVCNSEDTGKVRFAKKDLILRVMGTDKVDMTNIYKVRELIWSALDDEGWVEDLIGLIMHAPDENRCYECAHEWK